MATRTQRRSASSRASPRGAGRQAPAGRIAPRKSFLRAMLDRVRDPVMILPYVGYGTQTRLRICGRVLRDERVRPASDTASRWRNLVAFYKRMESDEVPQARLLARFRSASVETETDGEGYFDIEMRNLSIKPGWHDVNVALAEDSHVSATGRVLVPSPRARFGVISDLDDTVVWSNVGNKLKLVLGLAFSNARTRKPFPGVAAFYRALHAGINPIFYVSKSPWNLYEPIVEFLHTQKLPPGPLVLRDFGLRMKKDHKKIAIEEILRTYPGLGFVLIGDSGERDPEIYSDIVRRFPKRVRAIYIRSVDPERVEAIARLSREVAATGCQLVLAPDSEFAAAHAAGEGLIKPTALRAVRADKRSDERAPDAK